jgi:hypothetical protein
MSEKAKGKRERAGNTAEGFQKAWLEELVRKIDISSCSCYVPFVFIDNDYDPEDESQRSIFNNAMYIIYEDTRSNPLFPCERLNASPATRTQI